MEAKLCLCGCGQVAPLAKTTDKRFGHIKGQSLGYVRNHNLRKTGPEYIIDPDTGCWEWQLHRGRGGYGEYGNAWRLKNPGRSNKAHRVYYENFVGEIPEGLFVCHSCDNPGCVNPEHLWTGDAFDNMRDKVSKGRCGDTGKGKRRVDAENIRQLFIRRFEQIHHPQGGSIWRSNAKELAEIYDTTPEYVIAIVSGRKRTKHASPDHY